MIFSEIFAALGTKSPCLRSMVVFFKKNKFFFIFALYSLPTFMSQILLTLTDSAKIEAFLAFVKDLNYVEKAEVLSELASIAQTHILMKFCG